MPTVCKNLSIPVVRVKKKKLLLFVLNLLSLKTLCWFQNLMKVFKLLCKTSVSCLFYLRALFRKHVHITNHFVSKNYSKCYFRCSNVNFARRSTCNRCGKGNLRKNCFSFLVLIYYVFNGLINSIHCNSVVCWF